MPTPAMLLLKGVRNRDGDYEEITLSSTTPSAALKKKPCRRREAPPASNPSSGENLISGLPDECIHLVFSFLPSPRDRCSCAAVSRKWLLLLAHMRPSDFRSLKPAATAAGALSSLRKHGGDDDSTSPAAASRYLHSHKANDARLAAMAVGACARGAPAELVIRAAATACPAPAVSSLLLSVSDMGLNVISQACPKLRSLVLWNCAQVGNEGLAAVARNCPALEKLHVSNAPLVDDGGLIFLAMSCRKLSDLSLEACPRVGDAALRALPLFSSRLESFALQNCPMVRDVSLAAVLSSLPRLAKVRIADASTVGDAALEAIGSRGGGANNNPVLRSVCLENVTGLTHVGLRRLGMAASVQSLTVRCCTGLTDACFDNETGFVGLKCVTLRGCTGEGAGSAAPPCCPFAAPRAVIGRALGFVRSVRPPLTSAPQAFRAILGSHAHV